MTPSFIRDSEVYSISIKMQILHSSSVPLNVKMKYYKIEGSVCQYCICDVLNLQHKKRSFNLSFLINGIIDHTIVRFFLIN